MAPYLRGNVLTLGTEGQQLHQVEVVGQVPCDSGHRQEVLWDGNRVLVNLL